MKKYLILLFTSFTVVGQTCLTGDNYFYGQADIDNFLINNPNCTTIDGNLMIFGNDITNLNGLQNITTFNNGFWVESCPLLVSFSGVENVTYIGGYLEIGTLPLITNLDEFSNLTYVGGELDVTQLPLLTSLNGLVNITSSPTYFILWGDSSLTNLNGVNNIQAISTMIKFQDNPLLTDISALNSWDLSGLVYLEVKNNAQLSSCNQNSICDALNNGVTTFTIENNQINGCNTILEIENSCAPNSIEEGTLVEVNFYPNPAKSEILFNTESLKDVEVFSQTGQLLLHHRNVTTTMDISILEPGFYFVRIENSSGILTKKLIVERN